MHPLFILAQTECPSSAAFDWMLRAFGVAAIAFGVAAIIWALFNGIRSLNANQPASVIPAPVPAPPPAPARQHAPAAADSAQDIPQEIVAVIASAVHYIMGRPHRIISLKTVDPSWEKSGRQSVLTSHKIR